MTAGAWWQVAGGTLEVIGLITVMLGIGDTRRRFTDRPSVVDRVLVPFRWLRRKLIRKPQVVKVGVADEVGVGLEDSVRVKVVHDWKALSSQEAIRRMQDAIDRHEDMLEQLAEQLGAERAERRDADTQEQAARSDLRHEMESRIADAAAGGLTLETWGAALFGLGVLAQTIGVVVG